MAHKKIITETHSRPIGIRTKPTQCSQCNANIPIMCDSFNDGKGGEYCPDCAKKIFLSKENA